MRMLLMLIGIPIMLLGDGPGAAPRPGTARPHGGDAIAAGVVGSKHDFTDPTDETANACSACHIPHVQAIRPGEPETTQPLTSEVKGEPTVETYRIPGQRRVFEPNRFTPGPTSLVCLGCHDGTVATSTIGSAHALMGGFGEGLEIPSGNIWRDHPIGILYPNKPREYVPQIAVEAEGKIRLPEGRIECISCHDPHNRSGVRKMLVMSNSRSRLCLSCHIK